MFPDVDDDPQEWCCDELADQYANGYVTFNSIKDRWYILALYERRKKECLLVIHYCPFCGEPLHKKEFDEDDASW